MAVTAKNSPAKPPVDWTAVHARLARATDSLQAIASQGTTESQRELLVRRAKILSRPVTNGVAPTDLVGVVCFEISGQSFAFESSSVRETVIPRDLTPLPGLPAFVRGLVNVRSRVVPAFDLRPLLQLPVAPLSAGEKLLILAHDHAEFGVLAEHITGSREFSLSSLRREVPGLNNKYLRGISPDGFVLLDLSALFSDLLVDDHDSA